MMLMSAGVQPDIYGDQWPLLLKEWGKPVSAKRDKKITKILEEVETDLCAEFMKKNGYQQMCGLKCSLCTKTK